MTREEARALRHGDRVEVLLLGRWKRTTVDLLDDGMCDVGWVTVAADFRGHAGQVFRREHVRRGWS